MCLAGIAAAVAGARSVKQVKPVETWGEVFTGIKGIDQEIGFIYPSIVVVAGPPGSGRTTVLTKLAASRLAAGEAVAYFSSPLTPTLLKTIRRPSSTLFLTSHSNFASRSNTEFAASSIKGTYSIKADPNEVNITFSQVQGLLQSDIKWVIMDSVTPILFEYGSDAGLKLLRTLTAKARLTGVSLWVSYNSTAFTEQTTSLVKDCFEGVVELALEERKGVLDRLIRITHMMGRNVSGRWYRLEG